MNEELKIGDYVIDADEGKWHVIDIRDGQALLEEYIEDRRCRKMPISKLKRDPEAEEIYGDFWIEDDSRFDAWIKKQHEEES